MTDDSVIRNFRDNVAFTILMLAALIGTERFARFVHHGSKHFLSDRKEMNTPLTYTLWVTAITSTRITFKDDAGAVTLTVPRDEWVKAGRPNLVPFKMN